MSKKIYAVVTIVGLLILGVFLWNSYKEEQEQVAQYEDLSEKRRPLLIKKDELEQKLVDLKKEFEASKLPKGTTQIIFTGLEAEVYGLCYPIMKEYGYTGTLALSLTQLPGMEGRMTVEQFQELIDEGWDICVKWDTKTSLNKWWPKLEQKIVELGLQTGSVAYFTAGTYSPKLDNQLQTKGISTVIHHGEEGTALIQTAEEEGLWHLGAVGFMGEAPLDKLRQAIQEKGNITYLLGFELEDEMYNESSFRAMLSYFKQYVEKSELLVLQIEGVRQHYRERLEEYGQPKLDAYNQEKAVIEAELTAINEELNKLRVQ